MYLKQLEIQGFKSFPDKTVLNFGADITAIVGPNGSGKSNISDAILWVMGEQNSRQLRGAKMEDVIFGGTEKRNQMGFAQVTLVIDNTGHIFPRDESEVAVTRRYYRSGESEYYINRQSVRLKDVNELFMDTGMGREGYSIIGQGKIDEILSVKSGERREVFEEAAGISKYRHRKEESERKLQRTEENLVRINDKIAELELQVEPLRQQAETAKKYLVLRDELRVLEISVWLENLQALRAGALKLEADLRTAQEDRQRAQDALDAVYAAGEESLAKIQANDVRAEELRGQASGIDAQAQQESSAIAVLENSLSHDRQTLERLDRELADTQQRAGNLQEQADALTDRMAQIDRETEDLGSELSALMESLRQLAQSAGSAQQEAEALRAQETLAVAAAAQGRTELAALDATDAQAQARQTAIAADSAAANEKLDQCRREAAENNAALDAAREDQQAAANIIQGHSLKMEGRRRRAQEAAQQADQLRRQANAMEDRIRLLTEMEKEYEGFSRAVKAVMQAADRSTLSGIRGPVASLMSTQPQYTVALEIAEQLNWEMPDYLAISVGDGCTIAGVWKGFKDLYAIGFIHKLPRLISAQSYGCYPINRAIQENKPWEPMEENTIADSISVGVPRNADKALAAIRESNGLAVCVTDEEILAAQRLLGRTCGVFGEPAGVTGAAALKKACEQGLIGKDATVVSVVTGNGLKDVANAIKSAGEPLHIEPDLDLMVEGFAQRGVTVE